MKNWDNGKTKGCLFSIDLLDTQGGEIRATFFNDAANQFFHIVETDKVNMILLV
jgi:replication factor A1